MLFNKNGRAYNTGNYWLILIMLFLMGFAYKRQLNAMHAMAMAITSDRWMLLRAFTRFSRQQCARDTNMEWTVLILLKNAIWFTGFGIVRRCVHHIQQMGLYWISVRFDLDDLKNCLCLESISRRFKWFMRWGRASEKLLHFSLDRVDFLPRRSTHYGCHYHN